MNTLQLPRDIEKALQLRICILLQRSKSILRYLNSVYNIKLTQGVGIRTLLINNSVLTSLRVTCYNYTLAELYLIDLACNYILSQPNFQPGGDKDCRHLIDIHLFGEYNFSIPRDGVGIMTKPLRGDAISNP